MAVNDYCTLADVKAILPDISVPSTYDTILTTLITRASRRIDRFCLRTPGAFAAGSTPSTRYFNGSGRLQQWVDELTAAPAEVAVDETGDHTYVVWAATDYLLWPYNETPYTRLDVDVLNGTKAIWYAFPKSVRISGVWGFSTTAPADVVQAAITQTMRWFKRGQQGFQDVGAIADLGQLRFVQKLDPDIEGILVDGGYVRVVV